MPELPIIPLPEKMIPHQGKFVFSSKTVIVADVANTCNASILQALLASTSWVLPVRKKASIIGQAVILQIDPTKKKLGKEGYSLTITPVRITIQALTDTGVFYGIQTLRQLLPPQIEGNVKDRPAEWSVPCVEITDKPRFSWRGFMLDEGRHFLGKEIVLRSLDVMALQKLNVFHWHLTEDQGWRIEIKKYPLLTKVGSQRTGTGTMFKNHHDGIPHGGFYTQVEIKEIVSYASDRHILIVPEIEMPGHSLAALAAYPELSCTGGPFEVATHFGIFPDIYCAGKDKVFDFLQDVIDEVLELVPSPYIHIGGDEALKARWKKCPDCQRRIRQMTLKDEHALQVYFTNRIIRYLAKKGRRVIGWNEILEEGLAPDAVVQYWLGNQEKVVEEIRNQGRKVIVSTYLNTYLDHSHALTSLKDAYLFEPVFPGLSDKESSSILGLEPPLWTEWVPNNARMDFQTYPRLMAFAETAWSQRESKNYAGFMQRLQGFFPRLDILGVAYAGLRDVKPSFPARLFKMFSIAIPQTRVARKYLSQ